MRSWGWFCLGAMIVAYGVANLLQSIAVTRTPMHTAFNPRLLLRLGRQRAYLVGLVCQVTGFTLALLARRELPLFLVQSAVAAGLGVTTFLGVLVLKWRLPKAEIGLLALLCCGVGGLIVSARPAEARPLGAAWSAWLTVTLAVIAVLGAFAVRLRGSQGAVALGSLAGLGFGAAAVASRPLAGASSVQEFLINPLLYIVIAHSILGQLLLGLAMQRGSTTAAVAGMDAAAAVPAAVIGLLFLGDGIIPGRLWLAVAGFLGTLAAVGGLVHFAEPQYHCRPATGQPTGRRRAGAHRRLQPARFEPARLGAARFDPAQLGPARFEPVVQLEPAQLGPAQLGPAQRISSGLPGY